MKLISIIGTRPQYIKIKTLYDYCKVKKINHLIVDTNQHYSDNVSKNLIKDLNLEININLNLDYLNEIDFISKTIVSLSNIIQNESPDFVLIYGDTNSTFCAALSAYKLGVPIAHIEAGERCYDNSIPEEINRIFSDSVSKINFCSSRSSALNTGGIYCGDLEYDLLNSINPKIFYNNYGVMTIHRQKNCSKHRLNSIFNMCSKIPYNIKFFAHHRIKPFLAKIPNNVTILDPCNYSEMINYMSKCRFIITDSGSIQKTSAFFGKNTLVMRDTSEWKDTEKYGFAKLEEGCDNNIKWLLGEPQVRMPNLYSPPNDSSAKIIINKIINTLNK